MLIVPGAGNVDRRIRESIAISEKGASPEPPRVFAETRDSPGDVPWIRNAVCGSGLAERQAGCARVRWLRGRGAHV
jgi:hypothetical protein